MTYTEDYGEIWGLFLLLQDGTAVWPSKCKMTHTEGYSDIWGLFLLLQGGTVYLSQYIFAVIIKFSNSLKKKIRIHYIEVRTVNNGF